MMSLVLHFPDGHPRRLCGRGIHYAAGLKGDVSGENTQNWLRVKVKAEPPEIFDPSRRVL